MTTVPAPWIKRFPGDGPGAPGVTVVFPHAGGAAAAYRPLAKSLSAGGVETHLLQYPRRADRLAHPAPDTLTELAADLYAAANWRDRGPLQLFGHCMGAVVAFEFARIAEADGVPVCRLWASAGPDPGTVTAAPPLPGTDDGVLADIVDLGGTDPRLLDEEDFVELLLMAVHADYRALDRYSCQPGASIGADIHAVGGSNDHRVGIEQLRRWASYTRGSFALSIFDGGHFYLDSHLDAVSELMRVQ